MKNKIRTKDNKIDYGVEFENLWSSLDQGRRSSRKEMGYKVFKRIMSLLKVADGCFIPTCEVCERGCEICKVNLKISEFIEGRLKEQE